LAKGPRIATHYPVDRSLWRDRKKYFGTEIGKMLRRSK
jgi:hypothetical protein